MNRLDLYTLHHHRNMNSYKLNIAYPLDIKRINIQGKYMYISDIRSFVGDSICPYKASMDLSGTFPI